MSVSQLRPLSFDHNQIQGRMNPDDCKVTNGSITVGGPQFGKGYVCSVRMNTEDGFFSVLDLTSDRARDIGIQLLQRAGALSGMDMVCELLQGVRQ